MDRAVVEATPRKGLFDASARSILSILLVTLSLSGAVNCADAVSGSSLAANFDERRLQMISMPRLWSGLTSDEVMPNDESIAYLPCMYRTPLGR